MISESRHLNSKVTRWTALVCVGTAPQGLDGIGARRDHIISRVVLAEGSISPSDRLVVELVTPPDAPQMILVRWPTQPTVVQPRRFGDVASAAMRILASASTELSRTKARKWR